MPAHPARTEVQFSIGYITIKLMPRIITPGLAYKHLRRYRQVVSVLTKYGFGEFFGQLRIWEYSNIEKRLLRRKEEYKHLTTAQRLRLALEELGPTFIKMGQMLSTRPDIMPPQFVAELEKLQNRVGPMTAETARGIIESELKRPIEEVFSSFSDRPLAAASLAQVHRATIGNNQVVIKVQRPDITRIIEVDLDIMYALAALMERYLPGAYAINPAGLVREFSENIRREMDFRIEAANMKRFARNFAGTPWVHVPRIYFEQYNTRRLLIMEYIDGIHISEIDRLKREGYDLKKIAQHGADIGVRSTLDHGFFHADPHPGNLVILPGNVICLLDYGMMGTLSTRFRERLGRLIYYIVTNDEKRTARALMGMMESREAVDAETLEVEVSNIIQKYAYLQLHEMELGSVLFQLLRQLQEQRIRFPTHLLWLAKAITTIENAAQKLDPDFNMLEYAKPRTFRFIASSLNPVQQARESFLTLMDSLDVIRDLPYNMGIILDQLKRGRVKIEFEHLGLEPLRLTLNRISNRLAGTIVLAALLITSGLIIVADVPPRVGEIPVFGVIGIGLALFLAAGLFISMFFQK
ncbi:MAG: AarF/ABC1/UbiB kinase family protein [Dehalococcoidales bacterium]|nr:AarF/ABC1/UbiB kinase family protein [Dehalococcoidales bacterium]